MRKRIYEIIEVSNGKDFLSKFYDWFMLAVIFISLIPLAFKQETKLFEMINSITVVIFIIDYFLRLITADFKFKEKSFVSFIKYPFTGYAIIDLISILPSLVHINSSLKLLRIFRMIRTLRVFRVFKTLRYSKSFIIIQNVLKRSKDALVAVLILAISYIFIMALLIFNVEPNSFKTFFDAIYWATVSLTTVGYGDIYPISDFGRLITMISSMFGIAVIALPAGIITAGYMNEISTKEN